MKMEKFKFGHTTILAWLNISILRLITVPYSSEELSMMSEEDRLIATMEGREKVTGQVDEKISAKDLDTLRDKLVALCEMHHPTPIIVIDTDNFRDIFLVGMWFRDNEPHTIMEQIIYLAGNRAKIFEKKKQIWDSLEISLEDARAFIEDRIAQASKNGYSDPRSYAMKELAVKFPKVKDYIEEFPRTKKDIRIALADPDSRIICRIIGRDSVKVKNTALSYVKLYGLEGKASHISNEVFEQQ
jgi:hypothetical protein